jgi:hypothetical protein
VANGIPIAFRTGPGPVFVLAGAARVWIRGTAEATASGVDLAHVYNVASNHGWFAGPIQGQAPSTANLTAYLAATGDTAIE